MKKNVLFIVVIFALVLISCKKEEIIIVAPTVEKTDTPPTEMFGKSDIPYIVTTVYITEADVQDAQYAGNFTTTYRYYDEYDGHLVSTTNYSQDWYTIRVVKYWGVYSGQTYVSSSSDVYSISAQILSMVKEKIKMRNGDCIAESYEGNNEPTGMLREIGWVLPN